MFEFFWLEEIVLNIIFKMAHTQKMCNCSLLMNLDVYRLKILPKMILLCVFFVKESFKLYVTRTEHNSLCIQK